MNKYKIIFCLASIFSLSIIISCSDDETPEMEDNCDSITATYDASVAGIVNATCAYAGCHDGNNPNVPSYTTYSSMKATLDSGAFNSRTLVSKNMPPAGSMPELTAAQIEILTCWHEAGYPEN